MTDLTVIDRKDILGHLFAPEICSPFATLLRRYDGQSRRDPLGDSSVKFVQIATMLKFTLETHESIASSFVYSST